MRIAKQLLIILIILILQTCILKKQDKNVKQSVDSIKPDTTKGKTIVDYFPEPCYEIIFDGVKPLAFDSRYQGIIQIAANCDTAKLKLKSYKIEIAILKSRYDRKDTINIMGDEKSGNYKYIDSIKPIISNFIGSLRVKKNLEKDCVGSSVIFPIKFE
jgi:hypothetical protein